MEDESLGKLILQAPKNIEAQKKIMEYVADAWIEGRIRRPAIGSWESFYDTVIDGLTEILSNHQDGETILIVTSCGPISVIKHAITQPKSDKTAARIHWHLGNGSLSTLSCCPDRKFLNMEGYNDNGHFKAGDLATTL